MSPGFSHRPVGALTAKGAVELASLGLEVSDLRWFCDLFVGHPFDFAQRWPRSNEWPRVNGPALGESRIVGHLAGRYWIATNARKDASRLKCWTRFVTIDLDYGDDLRQRLRAVIRALGEPSFILQSSPSRGLHVYYLLREPCALYALRDDRGERGAVLALLAAAGIPESASRVEVYPRGSTFAFGQQNPLRLPFGLGCVLLRSDPDALLPKHGGGGWQQRRADFRFIRREQEAGRLPLASAADWLRQAGSQQSATRKAKRGRLRGDVQAKAAGASEEVARWLTDGLTEPGQLNAALKALAKHLRYQRRAEDETRAELHRWLNAKHNGLSRTYNASRRQAHAKVDEMVAWVFRNGEYAARGVLPELSVYEASRLLRLTGPDVLCLDPDTGEVLNRAKLRRVVFTAYRFGKQWVRDKGATLWRAEAGESGVVSDAVARRVVKAARSFWPAPSRPEFVVEQPSTLWVTLKGRDAKGTPGNLLLKAVDRDAIPAYKRAASALGLLPPLRPAAIGQCEAFGMHLDFGALSPTADTFATVDAAVAELGECPEIPGTYSRHIAQRQRSAAVKQPEAATLPTSGAARDQTPALSPFERLIRARIKPLIHTRANSADRVA